MNYESTLKKCLTNNNAELTSYAQLDWAKNSKNWEEEKETRKKRSKRKKKYGETRKRNKIENQKRQRYLLKHFIGERQTFRTYEWK